MVSIERGTPLVEAARRDRGLPAPARRADCPRLAREAFMPRPVVAAAFVAVKVLWRATVGSDMRQVSSGCLEPPRSPAYRCAD